MPLLLDLHSPDDSVTLDVAAPARNADPRIHEPHGLVAPEACHVAEGGH